MSKILGLDYGKKRCGISISDELQIIASPLTTIDTKKLMDFLKEIIVDAVSYTHLRAHET